MGKLVTYSDIHRRIQEDSGNTKYTRKHKKKQPRMSFFLMYLLILPLSFPQKIPCPSTHRDCSCSDVSYNDCSEPHPATSLHVEGIEECIANCELFHTFDQCDFLIFYTHGPHDNCRLIKAEETFEEYLHSCSKYGHPLFDTDSQCYTDSQDSCPTSLCEFCHSCPSEVLHNQCSGVRETGCSMLSPGHQTTATNQTDCQYICTKEAATKDWTYFTYHFGEHSSCTCYKSGERDCQVQVVKAGITWEQVENCLDPLPISTTTSTSTAVTTTHAPHTTITASPTTTPTTPTTTLTTTPTTPSPINCNRHTDCPTDFYCSCVPCTQIPGICLQGCRDQGDPCTTITGGDPEYAMITLVLWREQPGLLL